MRRGAVKQLGRIGSNWGKSGSGFLTTAPLDNDKYKSEKSITYALVAQPFPVPFQGIA